VKFHLRLSAAVAALAVGMSGTAAYATDGYFQDGYGASQTALAGAGVAYSQDAMAIALNPAGLTHVDDQTVAGMAIFMPSRSYSAADLYGPSHDPVAPGSHDSGNNWFPVPDFAWTKHLGPDTVLGIGLYGNGGMDTRYPNTVFQFPGSYGPTGIDLNQAFLSVSLSQRYGPLSVGVAPVFATQLFNAIGIGGFANPAFSASPANVSNNFYAISFGGGARVGAEYEFSPNLRIGVAGSTPIWMSNFDIYSGLFANHGNFDIPASITAGISYDVRPNITVMFDYKHIFYHEIESIGNEQPPFTPGLLGSSNGPGFGWNDVNVYKVGVQWQYNPRWTLRAGYSYNDSPLNARDIMFNILAPATVQHHITGGVKYAWSQNLDLEFSAMYAPDGVLKGNAPIAFGGQPIEISMDQVEVLGGIVYHWNGRQELEPLK
jgi:long-chain fatty acid transport protein